jgi:hypothetical protein
MKDAIPTAANRSPRVECTTDWANALPIAPPVRNSGTNIALTPPQPSENSVARSFMIANITSSPEPRGWLRIMSTAS